jgi:hypothetical protein
MVAPRLISAKPSARVYAIGEAGGGERSSVGACAPDEKALSRDAM